MILAFMTDPLWLALAAAFTLFRALTSKRATPLDVLLGRIPWPARKKDTPCTTAATTEWQVEPARGRHAMRLERGRDGLWHTGPMQAIPGGYGSLPDTPIDYWPSLYGPARQRIALDGETLRAARHLTGVL